MDLNAYKDINKLIYNYVMIRLNLNKKEVREGTPFLDEYFSSLNQL